MQLLIVDDHQLFRDGMKSLLQQWRPQLELLEAGYLSQALQYLNGGGYTPALVLLDLILPDSLEATETLQAVCTRTTAPVVAVSMLNEPRVVAQVVRGGARGFICKSDSAAVMLSTLDIVLAGGTCVPAQALAATPQEPEFALPLSERQLEVLHLIVQGLSNKEIGRRLAISEGTVKVHVHRILQLVGASSRAKVAAWARQYGLPPSTVKARHSPD